MATIVSGTVVTIRVDEQEERWQVVAPHEADHLRHRVSELSPLGFALLGHKAGDEVTVRGPRTYQALIVSVG